MNPYKEAWMKHAGMLFTVLAIDGNNEPGPYTNIITKFGKRIRMDPFNPVELGKTATTPEGQFVIRKVLSLI